MTHRKLKRKQWLDRRSKKIGRKKNYSVTMPHTSERSHTYVSSKRTSSGQWITLTPPSVFSFILNTENTMVFFDDFADQIRRQAHGTSFFIDSRDVEKVTVDALIYLIAILENKVNNSSKKYSYAGNYPDNQDANRVYQESGFNTYVKSHIKRLPESNDKMQIIGNTKRRENFRRHGAPC